MNSELRSKLSRIFGSGRGMERLVLVNTTSKDPAFTYLTKFKGGTFEYNFLVADRSGMRLYTNELELALADSQRFDGIRIIDTAKSDMSSALKKELKGKVVGINGAFLPYGLYKSIESRYSPKRMLDVSDCLAKARLVKSESEILAMQEASRITKGAMSRISAYFKAGMTERDLAGRFDDISESLGSEGTSFPSIICFGKNSALPHHLSGDTKLRRGDFVLIDAGAKVRNYCSDITRTFIFGGKSAAKDYARKMEIYDVVKEAQRIGIGAIRAGVKGSYVDGLARNYIDTVLGGKFKGCFIHTLGHSLGLKVHDGERLSQNSNVVLEEGMVFTVEPGVYVSGFGGVRIEDDVVVTKTGCRII